jgi:hypothetical protein
MQESFFFEQEWRLTQTPYKKLHKAWPEVRRANARLRPSFRPCRDSLLSYHRSPSPAGAGLGYFQWKKKTLNTHRFPNSESVRERAPRSLRGALPRDNGNVRACG